MGTLRTVVALIGLLMPTACATDEPFIKCNGLYQAHCAACRGAKLEGSRTG